VPVLVSACGVSLGDDGPAIQVYSARSYGAEEAYARFTEETGIRVEFLNGNDAELRERLQAEGDDSPADVFMTVDVANLALAAEQGVFRATASTELEAAVPDDLRDPQGRWFGLSVRARAIIYNTDAVDPAQLSTYEALADPALADRLCLRTATSAYTQSLVASMIANLGRRPRAPPSRAGSPTTRRSWPTTTRSSAPWPRAAATSASPTTTTSPASWTRTPTSGVGVFWPDQATSGVHVNISGAGVTQSSDSPAEAERFIQWLAPRASRCSPTATSSTR
jgi:iron(III) transport system substrate-binding protein